MSLVIVVPTYNEKQGLAALVEKIFSLSRAQISLLVVDDNSPDGTGALAEELALHYPVRVLHRPRKQGLGTAYADAFRQILSGAIVHPLPDYLMEMDADLSHDPTAIPQFLNAIRRCDLVLGSRYIPGGKIENWNALRRWISQGGNRYARRILGLPYRDLTSGFKCYRREVLENLDLERVSSVGYNFQIETTYKAHRHGYRVCEIPITFTERKTGRSKFHIGIILESFIRVLLLRFHA